jgi:hypothetical protein
MRHLVADFEQVDDGELISLLSLIMISGGVDFGTPMPNQMLAS